LTGEAIKEWIAPELFIEYKLPNVYHLLHELGFSWLSSNSKHPKQSQEARKPLKKLESN